MHSTISTPQQTARPAAQAPSPHRIYDTLLFSHARADALKAAIELDVFSAIGDGSRTIEDIAHHCAASVRGMRSLCDFLVVDGFLIKIGDVYYLAGDSRLFLDRRSPHYIGSVADFMASSWNAAAAQRSRSVRDGYPSLGASMTEPAIWCTYARAMLPVAAQLAVAVADKLDVSASGDLRVLDIAASHSEYGIAVARADPRARVVALDGPEVLAIARQRADEAGLGQRYHTIAGDAFTCDLGGPYDLVLLPNLLHGFDRCSCESLLRKINHALRVGGRLAIVELLPEPDRVTPPFPAMFSLIMLVSGPGDSYTFAELDEMLRHSGFHHNMASALPPTPQTLILSTKE